MLIPKHIVVDANHHIDSEKYVCMCGAYVCVANELICACRTKWVDCQVFGFTFSWVGFFFSFDSSSSLTPHIPASSAFVRGSDSLRLCVIVAHLVCFELMFSIELYVIGHWCWCDEAIISLACKLRLFLFEKRKIEAKKKKKKSFHCFNCTYRCEVWLVPSRPTTETCNNYHYFLTLSSSVIRRCLFQNVRSSCVHTHWIWMCF